MRVSVCVGCYLSALVSEELSSIVNDLLICEVRVRLLLTNAQHLPQSDSKRPHIAGCGEFTLRTNKPHTKTLQHQNLLCSAYLFGTILTT